MYRNRKPRWLKNERNLHNLHVIPTAAGGRNQVLDDEADTNVKHLPTPNVIQITPSVDSNDSKSFSNQIKSIGTLENQVNVERNVIKQKRKPRKPPAVRTFVQTSSFQWENSNYEDGNLPPEKEAEKAEGASGEENYFEEVEVASVEGELRQEILVGFRKSKPFYLKYKNKGHFKPKIYNLGDPTFVNCLNVQDDVDVDVDVISEAEYEYETDCLERSDSQEMLNKILEVDESEDESDSQEMLSKIIEVDESVDGDEIEMDLEASETRDDEVEKDLEVIETRGVEEVEKDLDANEIRGGDKVEKDLKVNEIRDGDKVEKDLQVNEIRGGDKVENDLKVNEIRGGDKVEKDAKVNEIRGGDKIEKDLEVNKTRGGDEVKIDAVVIRAKGKSEEEIEVIDISGDDEMEVANETLLKSSTSLKSTERAYKSCVEGNNEFTQGKCSIQNALNSWKSHLIGLEYLVEIKNANLNAELKHYCVLCCEDLEKLGYPAISVINHINSIKHIVSYLEKHFPALGYKFAESGDYNIVLLQRITEEISRSLGYYFMCVTNSEYYAKNVQNIKKMIEDAYHPNEKDLKLDKNLYTQNFDSYLKDETQNLIYNIIEKISAPSAEVGKSGSVKDNKNVLDDGKGVTKKQKDAYFNTYKGYSPLTTYMLLDSFASSAFKKAGKKASARKSAKTLSTGTKETCVQKDVKGLSASTAGKSNENVVKGLLSTSIAKKSNQKVVKELPPSTEEKIVKESSSDTKGKSDGKGLPANTEEPCIGKSVEKVFYTSTKEMCVEKNVKGMSSPAEKTLGEKDNGAQDRSEFDSGSAVTNIIVSQSSQKVHRIREKIALKPSALHSKYCRKRILGKETARLKLAKATSNNEFVSGISNKFSGKNKAGTVSVSCETGKKIPEKLKLLKPIKNSSQMMNFMNKIAVVQKTSVDSKLSAAKYSSAHHRIIHKKDNENSSTDQVSAHHRIIHKKVSENSSTDKVNALKESPSVWRPIMRISRSPVKSSTADSTLLLKSQDRKSRSPVIRNVRKHSKSPLQRIRSPLRLVARQSFETLMGIYNPSRIHSRSPAKRKSRSPARRKSRSPVRRKSRSPARRKSRSPIRRKSRSPFWKFSRSPVRKKSRSPLRRHSRSPFRRHSRSPLRHHSRSPLRLRSRSPLRMRSRSPLRLRSRSPVRRRSRSPVRRRPRSPGRRHSRSPFKHLSRSPLRRQSRSPVKRKSRSPMGRYLRSPIQKYSESAKYRSEHSLDLGHNVGEHFSEEKFLSSIYSYDKRLSSHTSELSKYSKDVSKISSKRNRSDKFKSHIFPQTSLRDISDLDPVSDEDESIYFNDKQQHTEEVNIPQSSKLMLTKLLQKISVANLSPNDPALNKLMQFMEAHSSEIQDLVGSQSKPVNVAKVDTSLQERTFLLQQLLLSNLAGTSSQEPIMPSPAAPHVPPKFMQTNIQPSFTQVTPGFQHPPNLLLPNVSPQPIQQRFFPPNVNIPPPQLYSQPINQPRQEFLPKPSVAPEVMFKDLKATVNKLFGANEGLMKQEKPQGTMLHPHLKPGYVTEPDPDKWDLSHPDTPKFNASVGSKNVFQPQGKNIEFNLISPSPNTREEIPMFNNNAAPSGQYFGGRGINRPQIPSVPVPPPDAKVSFCEVSRSSKGNLFPVVNTRGNPNFNPPGSLSGGVSDVKVSLAQRLASVLVKVGMTDVPAPLLQEMLMKIGAFSSSPRQDISETEIISILKRLGYL